MRLRGTHFHDKALIPGRKLAKNANICIVINIINMLTLPKRWDT